MNEQLTIKGDKSKKGQSRIKDKIVDNGGFERTKVRILEN
jgi:hypothetical protein